MAARRMEVLRQPSAETTIWRYYPLDRFLALISARELFFAPATSFEDPYEGDYGVAAKEAIRDRFGDSQYLRDFNTSEFLQSHTYISCWHESDHESDAMWKLYGRSIAVKSTFGSINKLLTWSKTEVKTAGRVNYIDYSVKPVNVEASYLPYFFKRMAFHHEQEVRFLIQEHRDDWSEYPPPSPGKRAPLNFNADIVEIVVAPTVEAYVANAVEKIVRALDVDIPIRQSTLLAKPVW
ncbi:hypothetical protein [Variovorax sp. GB1P17]|uniref:hypothetical protein n=1 Tax=Variovorax sp. GB1P17 TaxID=3443740 RepID=UPI003F47E5C8